MESDKPLGFCSDGSCDPLHCHKRRVERMQQVDPPLETCWSGSGTSVPSACIREFPGPQALLVQFSVYTEYEIREEIEI